MTDWGEYTLVAMLCVADLLVLHGVRRVVRRRQAATRRYCAHQLDELDQRPEFDPAPADWPLRESPPRELERAR